MLLVADIFEHAVEILGYGGGPYSNDTARVFSRLTEATKLLANKGLWDPTVGELCICVGDENEVTLPRFVKSVLALNINGQPSIFTNKWFDFHVNGPGSMGNRDSIVSYTWQDKGDFVTFQDPLGPARLVTVLEDPDDANCNVRVFGFDATGREIRTPNCTTGELEAGFLVPTMYGASMPDNSVPEIVKITRITKDVTKGCLKLIAWDKRSADGYSHIGYYYPDETEPTYRRIRVSRKCSNVFLKYKKADAKIRSMYDLIPLHSETALMMTLKALVYYETDRLQDSIQYIQAAEQLLIEEQESRSGPGFFAPQIVIGGDAQQAWENMV